LIERCIAPRIATVAAVAFSLGVMGEYMVLPPFIELILTYGFPAPSDSVKETELSRLLSNILARTQTTSGQGAASTLLLSPAPQATRVATRRTARTKRVNILRVFTVFLLSLNNGNK